MRIASKLMTATFAVSLLFASCGKGQPFPVDDLEITKTEKKTATATATVAPVTYDVTVTWSSDAIMNDKTAKAALTGFTVYADKDGTDTPVQTTLATTATTTTFTGLLPGVSYYITVIAEYKDGVYDDPSIDTYLKRFEFVGGPWITSSAYNQPYDIGLYYSTANFNKADSLPAGATSADFYPDVADGFSSEFFFSAVGDARWIIVNAYEPNATNDTATTRQSKNWVGDDLYLLDSNRSSAITDLADVKLEVMGMDGTVLATLSETSCQGSLSAINITTLRNSFDDAYYTDKDAYFFIKATCEAMPTSYSATNTAHAGTWGLAMPASHQ